jgi:hypothetical protein
MALADQVFERLPIVKARPHTPKKVDADGPR